MQPAEVAVDDFQALVADRKLKRIMHCGPDRGWAVDPTCLPSTHGARTEAGFPWERDYARVNPEYFDMADLRIQYMVDRGIMPCIVGCWGYFLPQMGIRKMKQHWRYLIARWSAWPIVVVCLAGEGTMPFYLFIKTPEKDRDTQKHTDGQRWPAMSAPPIHCITSSRFILRAARGDSVDDPSVLDFRHAA